MKRSAPYIICLCLAVLVWAVFGQTHNYDFVNYDDDEYVYDNPIVHNGVTWEGIKEVFTSDSRGIHYPLTMLSFMADREFQGMESDGFHRTNVLLHAATVMALFLILLEMTGSLWRSAFVAVLFAIHPLRVESVAWIAERKDVLSGFFFMATLAAYLHYTRRSFSVARYALVGLLFSLGLLAKPMLATLPFVLLLLDYWPLERWSKDRLRRLILEKIPFLFLSALSLAMATTSHAALDQGAAAPPVSLFWRIGNACVAYGVYLRQMFWPTDLAPHYPHLGTQLPLWQIGGAVILLTVVSGVVLFQRKNRPWLLVGWLWYLGMLFPTIGIVRILGESAHADRFTYLPQIGLYILLAWTATEGSIHLRWHRTVLPALSIALLAVLAGTTHRQTTHWKDSIALWNHTLECTTENALAHNNLALAFDDEGNWQAATRHYEQAIRIHPNYPHANNNLGLILSAQGKTEEAIRHFKQAIQGNPNLAEPYYGLGVALLRQGTPAEALPHFDKGIRLAPDLPAPYFGMGAALAAQGKPNEAVPFFEQAIRLDPSVAAPYVGLGRAWAMQGRFDEAVLHFKEALRLQPRDPATRDLLQRALTAHKKSSLPPESGKPKQ